LILPSCLLLLKMPIRGESKFFAPSTFHLSSSRSLFLSHRRPQSSSLLIDWLIKRKSLLLALEIFSFSFFSTIPGYPGPVHGQYTHLPLLPLTSSPPFQNIAEAGSEVRSILLALLPSLFLLLPCCNGVYMCQRHRRSITHLPLFFLTPLLFFFIRRV